MDVTDQTAVTPVRDRSTAPDSQHSTQDGQGNLTCIPIRALITGKACLRADCLCSVREIARLTTIDVMPITVFSNHILIPAIYYYYFLPCRFIAPLPLLTHISAPRKHPSTISRSWRLGQQHAQLIGPPIQNIRYNYLFPSDISIGLI